MSRKTIQSWVYYKAKSPGKYCAYHLSHAGNHQYGVYGAEFDLARDCFCWRNVASPMPLKEARKWMSNMIEYNENKEPVYFNARKERFKYESGLIYAGS